MWGKIHNLARWRIHFWPGLCDSLSVSGNAQIPSGFGAAPDILREELPRGMHPYLLTGYTFKPWNSLWPTKERSTLIPPGCPRLLLCINCLLSLFYSIKGGMKNKACSLSMTSIYLCYVKAKKNICSGLPEEGAFSFSLANQCQARAGMGKEGGESLLAIWPYPSGSCVPFFCHWTVKWETVTQDLFLSQIRRELELIYLT